MSGSILSISMSGLNAAQAGLVTTSHNIANVNTAGYSRQQIIQGTQPALYTGSGFFGQGTTVESVRRYYNSFLTAQMQATTSSSSQLEILHDELVSLDNVLGDPSASLAPAINEFFSGVNGVAARPSDMASRQVMLADARALVSRFGQLAEQLAAQQSTVNQQIEGNVEALNGYATQIAALNNRVSEQTAATGGLQQPNDLLDQRDQLITEVNKLIGVSTVPQVDGSVNLFLSNGQALVVGGSATELSILPEEFDPANSSLAIKIGGVTRRLDSSDFSGGEISGLLSFRDTALADAQNSLGQIAMVLGQTFNDQHRLGIDLNGAPGSNFFTMPVPKVAPVTTNAGNATVSVTLADAKALTASDYLLEYGATGYTLTRMSDGQTSGPFVTLASPGQTVDGLKIAQTGGAPAAGDRFVIQPTRYGAGTIGLAVTDPVRIAAAAPISTSAPGSNTGSGTISAGSVDAGYLLSPPLAGTQTLTYASATKTFSGFPATVPVTVTLNGSSTTYPAGTPVPYTDGATISFGGISVVIAGSPANGDTFTIGPNTNPGGDSRNAVLLGKLATTKLVEGTSTYTGSYAELVSTVGAVTHQAEVEATAQQALLEQAQAAEQAVSGVNLDEEAANLQRYQQAYQASAKLMNIASTLFDTILAIGQ